MVVVFILTVLAMITIVFGCVICGVGVIYEKQGKDKKQINKLLIISVLILLSCGLSQGIGSIFWAIMYDQTIVDQKYWWSPVSSLTGLAIILIIVGLIAGVFGAKWALGRFSTWVGKVYTNMNKKEVRYVENI